MHAFAHWGCMDIVRQSAMEADSGRKIPCHTGVLNRHQYCTWLFNQTLLPTELSLPLNIYLPVPWLVWSPGCHDKHLSGSGTGLVTRVPWQTSWRSVLGLVWSPGCHDKHLSGQFWDWSRHQGAKTNISGVSSGTGLDTEAPWQTSQQSFLGLVWSPGYHEWWQTSQRSVLGLVLSPEYHDKHLSSHFWDWSSGCHDEHLCSQSLDQLGQLGATTIISAVWNPWVPQATCDSCFAYQSICQSVTDKQVAASLFETRWRCCSWCHLMYTAQTFFSSCFRSSDCGEPQAGRSVCLCGNQHVLRPGPHATGVSAGASPQHVRGKRSSAPQGQADLGWLWRSRGWRWSVGVATVCVPLRFSYFLMRRSKTNRGGRVADLFLFLLQLGISCYTGKMPVSF